MEVALGLIPSPQTPYLVVNPAPQHNPSRGHISQVDAHMSVTLYSMMETHLHFNHANSFEAQMSVNVTSPLKRKCAST